MTLNGMFFTPHVDCYQLHDVYHLLFSIGMGKIGLKLGFFYGTLALFLKVTSQKEGILKTARPAKTRPNGHIPVPNGGMAGL